MFEGVEAKNIMRTAVLPTLLSDPEVRIVLLMKNEERIERYQKEFASSRIVYQAVPEYYRGSVSRLDRVFAALKFFLLRTETTLLQRRLAFEENRRYVSYYLGGALRFLFARPLVRRLARYLDFALVRNNLYAQYFDRYEPQLVFLAHLFEEPEIHILREAKRRDIRTVGFVNSWDKVTARCIMRLLPDTVLVFNRLVQQHMIVHNEMQIEDVAVVGIPHYDRYCSPSHAPRKEFFKHIGIDPTHKLIVCAPAGSRFSTSDWDMIDFLDELIRTESVGPRVSLLVRFQPNDFIDERELKKRPQLRYDYPGKRFAITRGVDWDMDKADLAHLTDTLRWMDLLICYGSSLSVDAAMFDKPIININFEFKEFALPSKSPTKFYRMTHYAEALRSGGIRLVANKEELVEWMKRYLADPSLDREGRARLMREQCEFTDGRSGARIGAFLLAMLKETGRT